MRKTYIWVLLLSFLLGGCATKSVKKTSLLPIVKLPAKGIKYIHEKLTGELSADSLKEILAWGQEQETKVKNYLKEQLFLKAQFFYLDGNYEKARDFYKGASDLDLDDIYLMTRYAITLIRLGDLKTAQVFLRKSYEKKPIEKIGMLLAGVEISLNNGVNAQKVYREILVKNPQAEQACLFLGKSYVRDKKSHKALRQFNQCLKKMEKKETFYYEKATVYISLKKYKKAEKSFKKALKLKPDYAQAVLALGNLYESLEKGQKAYKMYQSYIAKYPEDYLILNKLIAWHLEVDDGVGALPFIEKLVDLDNGNINLRARLGILYVESGRYKKAISIFQEILEMNPAFEKIHYYLGVVFQEIKEFEQAIFHYSQVSEKSGLFDDSILQISMILNYMAQVSNDNRERFLSHAEQFKKRPSLLIDLSVMVASYYEDQGEYAQAINELEGLRTNEGFQESHLFYMISLYEKNNQIDFVDKELKAFILKNPDNAQALNFLGYSYLERGVHKKTAFKYIKKALTLSPDDGYIRDSMGWYYHKHGDYKKALLYLRKAYKDSSEDSEVALHLAATYQALGEFKKASLVLRKALKKTDSSQVRKMIAEAIKKVISLQNVKRLPASEK